MNAPLHPTAAIGHLVWHADTTEPEKYGSDVGGDNQISDVWFVRLVNRRNHSTVDVSVYVSGFPFNGNDEGQFDETGVEVCIEWSEWQDAERQHEGFADVTYEAGNPLAYPTDDESVHDLFEHECKRIAKDYIKHADRDIWWDGHSPITH